MIIMNRHYPKIQYKKIPWHDPFIAYAKLKGAGPSFLLESPAGSRNSMTSRYSFIGVNPSIVIEGKGDKVKIAEGNDIRILNGNPLEVVKSILKNREMTGRRGCGISWI